MQKDCCQQPNREINRDIHVLTFLDGEENVLYKFRSEEKF